MTAQLWALGYASSTPRATALQGGKLSEWYVPPQIVTRKKVGCAARR